LPVLDTTVIDTNKLNGADQKSTLAKPVIKSRQKKNAIYSHDKNTTRAENTTGKNEPVNAEEINLTRR